MRITLVRFVPNFPHQAPKITKDQQYEQNVYTYEMKKDRIVTQGLMQKKKNVGHHLIGKKHQLMPLM